MAEKVFVGILVIIAIVYNVEYSDIRGFFLHDSIRNSSDFGADSAGQSNEGIAKINNSHSCRTKIREYSLKDHISTFDISIKNTVIRNKALNGICSSINDYNTNVQKYKGHPWRKNDFHYARGVLGLHQEIEHFYSYIKPTAIEIHMRNRVIKRLESEIRDTWKNADVKLFGSYLTGLFLPTSDIDLCVVNKWDRIPLGSFVEKVIKRGLAEPQSVVVHESAKVPVLKFLYTDNDFEMNIDIVSLNEQDENETDNMIKKYKEEHPELSRLVLVLKQFMRQRHFNKVYFGGLTSYSLVLLCISFLQLHMPAINHENVNLGFLLLQFFDLYGRKFDYMNNCISLKNGGHYMTKDEIKSLIGSKSNLPQLCIENPIDKDEKLIRVPLGIVLIKQAFEDGYMTLSKAINPFDNSNNSRADQSILGQLITIDDDEIEYRKCIQQYNI